MSINTVKSLPVSERPYEKFLSNGAESLSDAELLAIILKTGTKSVSSIDLATEILKGHHGNILNLYDMSLDELQQINGIGKVKAIQLKTIAELSKRISRCRHSSGIIMNTPNAIADYFMEDMRHTKEEIVVVAFFDSKMQLKGSKKIAQGALNCAYLEPRAVIKAAISNDAVSIVLLHNHPSGDPTPSRSDHDLTSSMVQALGIVGIILGDHIIIGDNKYYSFRENNYIN